MAYLGRFILLALPPFKFLEGTGSVQLSYWRIEGYAGWAIVYSLFAAWLSALKENWEDGHSIL
jgi:hypothetical protein